ncbi:hypothetical protein U1Q18_021682 [Sarracenia purpurea var. burkii]
MSLSDSIEYSFFFLGAWKGTFGTEHMKKLAAFQSSIGERASRLTLPESKGKRVDGFGNSALTYLDTLGFTVQ